MTSDLFSLVPPSACGWTLCGLSEWRSSTDTLPSLHEADWPPLLQPPTGVHSEPPPPLLCSTNDLRDQTLLLKTHCSFKFRLLFSKDWSQVRVKTFIMLPKISISNQCCSFEPSIQKNPEEKSHDSKIYIYIYICTVYSL